MLIHAREKIIQGKSGIQDIFEKGPAAPLDAPE